MSQETIRNHFSPAGSEVESYLDRHFVASEKISNAALQSVRYSLLQKGAKRFRAKLVLLTAEALGHSTQRVLPWAASIECVHAYSLIHDDLPCMDNDDFRRGQPTNHKVYGEATALLAGDALLTEAFGIIAQEYRHEPGIALQLVTDLCAAAGIRGMISGQMRDISNAVAKSIDELQLLQEQKTGALINVSVTGAARLCFANDKHFAGLNSFARNLGLAFQVKDDILDYSRNESSSYSRMLGLAATQSLLSELTEKSLVALEVFGPSANALRLLAEFNVAREN